MNVIMLGVAVSDGDPLMAVGVHPQAFEVVPGDLVPPARIQAFAGRQSKT
jgi:hypothetical protein